MTKTRRTSIPYQVEECLSEMVSSIASKCRGEIKSDLYLRILPWTVPVVIAIESEWDIGATYKAIPLLRLSKECLGIMRESDDPESRQSALQMAEQLDQAAKMFRKYANAPRS